jgi:mannose-6-phosphate isomerase
VERLQNPIRKYAWGSRTVIARMQGREPSGRPEAEMWIGAHPDEPSTLEHSGLSLADAIAAAPERMLGDRAVAAFGVRLPYLLKVLAADEPLSLQAHPDARRARDRFAAGDPNYTDPHHKPELLVAISDFEAMCGFRDPKASAETLQALAVPELAPVVDALGAGDPGLRPAVSTLLGWPEPERRGLVEAVVAAGRRVGDTHPSADEYAMVRRLADRYPADVGAVVALLLNHVRLAPGEAIWLPPGNLHSYLRGVGVEVMAASDNVLRGGLTQKRVDVGELLAVLRFESLTNPVVRPVDVAAGVVTWPVPAAEFALFRVRLDDRVPSAEVAPAGPRVALCVGGELVVSDDHGTVTLHSGRAAYGAADAGRVRVSGRGEGFLVGVR